jgi:hypothetical protein
MGIAGYTYNDERCRDYLNLNSWIAFFFIQFYWNDLTGKVRTCDEQYFGSVPLKAWEFYIGGYQAQRPSGANAQYGGDTARPEDYCGFGGDGEGYGGG